MESGGPWKSREPRPLGAEFGHDDADGSNMSLDEWLNAVVKTSDHDNHADWFSSLASMPEKLSTSLGGHGVLRAASETYGIEEGEFDRDVPHPDKCAETLSWRSTRAGSKRRRNLTLDALDRDGEEALILNIIRDSAREAVREETRRETATRQAEGERHLEAARAAAREEVRAREIDGQRQIESASEAEEEKPGLQGVISATAERPAGATEVSVTGEARLLASSSDDTLEAMVPSREDVGELHARLDRLSQQIEHLARIACFVPVNQQRMPAPHPSGDSSLATSNQQFHDEQPPLIDNGLTEGGQWQTLIGGETATILPPARCEVLADAQTPAASASPGTGDVTPPNDMALAAADANNICQIDLSDQKMQSPPVVEPQQSSAPPPSADANAIGLEPKPVDQWQNAAFAPFPPDSPNDAPVEPSEANHDDLASEQRIDPLVGELRKLIETGQAVWRSLEELVVELKKSREQGEFGCSNRVPSDIIEDRISDLAQRLDLSDSRHSYLEAVERGFVDLLDCLERINPKKR